MFRIGWAIVLLAISAPSLAASKCTMRFDLAGWSLFYKTASGTGTVTCDNGQQTRVKLSAKGGGLTAGRSKITDGIATFTEVDDITELFGSYAQSEAHAGATKSARASAMTKGEVSMSFAGKGQGVNLGISFGKFTISPVE